MAEIAYPANTAAGIVMESITEMENHPEDWQAVTRRSISVAGPALF